MEGLKGDTLAVRSEVSLDIESEQRSSYKFGGIDHGVSILEGGNG